MNDLLAPKSAYLSRKSSVLVIFIELDVLLLVLAILSLSFGSKILEH